MKEPSVAFVDLKSARIFPIPGATIDEARGVRKVHVETRETHAILIFGDQFMGFSGSPGESQNTISGSSLLVDCVFGRAASFSCSAECEVVGAELVELELTAVSIWAPPDLS